METLLKGIFSIDGLIISLFWEKTHCHYDYETILNVRLINFNECM